MSDLAGLDEAMLVRKALESAIIEKAAARATPEGVASLRAILDQQAAAIAAGDFRAFHGSDEMFHSTLAELSGYPGVWPIILQAKIQVDRYRQLTLPLQGRMGGVLAKHNAVVDAIAAGDPVQAVQAVQAMRAHLDHVLPVLELSRKLRPEYFTAQPPARTAGRG